MVEHIEHCARYWATVDYHRTDDLREPSQENGPTPVPPNGDRILVTAGWLMQEDENFPGEWAFLVEYPLGYCHWLPQRDLIDLEREPKRIKDLGIYDHLLGS
jgi:hypothetical protein